uniref:Uncharacterized protein n=1 Tax=Cacopsylla melanoneura TaxID=428564 RepID=A0A8D8UMF6_9HEMI
MGDRTRVRIQHFQHCTPYNTYNMYLCFLSKNVGCLGMISVFIFEYFTSSGGFGVVISFPFVLHQNQKMNIHFKLFQQVEPNFCNSNLKTKQKIDETESC